VRPDRRPFAVSGIDHVQHIPGEAEAALLPATQTDVSQCGDGCDMRGNTFGHANGRFFERRQ
jgi:hypothetical protein